MKERTLTILNYLLAPFEFASFIASGFYFALGKTLIACLALALGLWLAIFVGGMIQLFGAKKAVREYQDQIKKLELNNIADRFK